MGVVHGRLNVKNVLCNKISAHQGNYLTSSLIQMFAHLHNRVILRITVWPMKISTITEVNSFTNIGLCAATTKQNIEYIPNSTVHGGTYPEGTSSIIKVDQVCLHNLCTELTIRHRAVGNTSSTKIPPWLIKSWITKFHCWNIYFVMLATLKWLMQDFSLKIYICGSLERFYPLQKY